MPGIIVRIAHDAVAVGISIEFQFARIRIALGNLRGDGNQALILEPPNRRGRCVHELEQLLQRKLAAFFKDVPDFRLAFG